MKIYIAGSSKDIERCEGARDAALAAGIDITEDWMTTMRESGPDSMADGARLIACAMDDLVGVAIADVMWLLTPPADKPSSGCWSELTWAMAHKVPVITSAPVGPMQFNIFATLIPGHLHFLNDEDALAFLVSLYRATESGVVVFAEAPDPVLGDEELEEPDPEVS